MRTWTNPRAFASRPKSNPTSRGQLSHGSVVAREYGIPAVVNVGPATRIIKTGQVIRVDGNRGEVTVVEGEARVIFPLGASTAVVPGRLNG